MGCYQILDEIKSNDVGFDNMMKYNSQGRPVAICWITPSMKIILLGLETFCFWMHKRSNIMKLDGHT